MHAFSRPSPRLSRRSLLALAATAPLTAAPLAATPAAAASDVVVGGARLVADGVQVNGGGALPKKLTARAWLLADQDSGEVLACYRAHLRVAPASTLKMLFADTLLDRFEHTERYRVTDADLAGIPSGSSLVGVKAGVTYTVGQLWQGVFLRSGNDAVQVLARMNGGVAKTVAEMQARAVDLQALDTHVVSPDGYDHDGQLSSAYDLALFARHGLRDADFRAYCGTRTAEFPAGGGKTFRIENTDRLLSGTYGVTPYPGLIGVKNGFTSNAGNTFTGAATRAGRTLVVTVLHPKSGHNAVYEETAALLDWGFAQGSSARAVGTLVEALSEGGTRASGSSAGRAPHAGAQASSVDGAGPDGWGALGGAGGAVALLAGGAYALRRRRCRSGEVPPAS
ncbi:D-alanyl-D-alanine carboxypeptidase family protein [Streptomyces sp. SLBN-115]|uniref:D-alanyl-D-alanine carboxypeptidase family protein n=1 Tax=Streptomyces sp. SLBN-115 TaxID=2768453 RepID=UPI00114DEFDA|nr:serine hydrolase [Streptomyces sp. SLBN-115]TQJ52580.1 D-alanyl-D-alanine carboxypeptidase (penicillin-binding protein 5/6) [Streptomyces sp. SLBN-115]